MSSHKGRALRVSIFILINLMLAAVVAALGIFFYSAYQAIHYHSPMRLWDFYPVEVTEQVGEFDRRELLLVYGGKEGDALSFYGERGCYLAKADGSLFALSAAEELSSAEGVMVFSADEAGPLLRFILSADRLYILLLAVVLGLLLLELLLCLLLLGKKKHHKGKRSHDDDSLSELDKYADLDYNPFPQKLYSSKVEMVEIEDYPKKATQKNVALKVGELPVKVAPLADGTELSESLDGYTVTLTVKKQ